MLRRSVARDQLNYGDGNSAEEHNVYEAAFAEQKFSNKPDRKKDQRKKPDHLNHTSSVWHRRKQKGTKPNH